MDGPWQEWKCRDMPSPPPKRLAKAAGQLHCKTEDSDMGDSEYEQLGLVLGLNSGRRVVSPKILYIRKKHVI